MSYILISSYSVISNSALPPNCDIKVSTVKETFLIFIMCRHMFSLFSPVALCGIVVRVSGYRYRGPGFDPRRYQIF